MIRKISLVSGLLVLAGIVGAAEPPRQNYECDTPEGHFAYWNRTVSADTIDITGTLTVNEIRKDKKWTPAALVLLKTADGEKTSFGIRLYALVKAPELYFIEIVKPGDHEKLGLGFVPATSEPIPFAIHFDGTGQLRVSFAGVDGGTSVGNFKPAQIQFSCSTGDFEFKDFVIKE